MSDQHVRRLKWKPLHFLKKDGVADSLTKANASAAGYQSVMFEKLTTLTIVDHLLLTGIQEQALSSLVHLLLKRKFRPSSIFHVLIAPGSCLSSRKLFQCCSYLQISVSSDLLERMLMLFPLSCQRNIFFCSLSPSV